MKDIIIIGGGPAGLTAALYAGRAELDALLIEKNFHGGQMINTNEIENYPGLLEITGPELAMKMYEQVQKFNVPVSYEDVTSVELEGPIKKVITSKQTYEAKVVILAMGAKAKQLGLSNEQSYWGKGISYCAICDAAFYKDKVVAVVGGGDTALEDALYLERIAKKVYLIHRRDSFRGAKHLQTRLFNSKVEIIWNSQVTKLYGEPFLEGIEISSTTSDEKKDLLLNGLFVAIGSSASSGLVASQINVDPQGYIIADENCITNIPGVFAIGDIRQKGLRQIVTATADGGVSIYQAEKYLSEG